MTRAQWLRLHRYAGLAMAAFLLMQAMTGALLLYRGPAARLIDPAGMRSHGTGPAISAGEAVAQAHRFVPGFTVTRLYAPDDEGAVYLAQLARGDGAIRYAAIDPAGGGVRRTGTLWRFPVEAALQLHFQLNAGKTGMLVVALNALALILMAVSGLVYWWPKRKPVKALAVRWTLAPRLVLRQLHRTAGVVAAALLCVLATTGLLLILPELTGASSAPALRTVPGPVVDRALSLAQAAFPGHALRDVRINGPRITVHFAAPERNARAVHRVSVALDPMRVDKRIDARDNGALWMTVLPIHAGDIIGRAGPALLMLVALTLIALALSGPVMWWHATAPRRAATRQNPRRTTA